MKAVIFATLATGLTAGLAVVPFAMATGSIEEAKRALQIGSDHGITHFYSIELDDDDSNHLEIEGWIDEQWFVALDVNRAGTILKEERRRRIDGPWGMSAADATHYIDASVAQGMTRIEELKIDTSGHVEVEGEDAQGELEVNFSSTQPESISIERDS